MVNAWRLLMSIFDRRSLALTIGMAAAVTCGTLLVSNAAMANDAAKARIAGQLDVKAVEAGLEPHQIVQVRRNRHRGRRVIVAPRRGRIIIRRGPRYYSAPRFRNRCAVVYNRCYAAYGRGSRAYYRCMHRAGC
jgi:hypothetical protein